MEKNPTMLLVVAAALINEDGLVLLQKRPENKVMAGLWEFPGGKVEAGEQLKPALARELKEELDIDVDPPNLHPLTFASQPVSSPVSGRDMLLLLYICRHWGGQVTAIESPDIKWVAIEDMHHLPMPPADVPFIPMLADYLKRSKKN